MPLYQMLVVLQCELRMLVLCWMVRQWPKFHPFSVRRAYMKKLGCLFLTGVMVLMIFIGVWSQQSGEKLTLAALIPTVTTTPEALTLRASPEQALEVALPSPTAQLLPATTVNDSANLRSGPGTNFQVVDSATAGETVKIVARNDAGEWYQLENGYWIAAFLVNNAPQELAVVEVAVLE